MKNDDFGTKTYETSNVLADTKSPFQGFLLPQSDPNISEMVNVACLLF